MKHIYKLLLALIAVAAGWGQKATAQNSGGFGYAANCLKVSLWAQDKRAFDSCAQVKFTLNNTYVTGVQTSYTFPSAGTYTVCMKIYNPCKKWDTSICQTITVKSCKSCDWSKAAWSYRVDCRKITVEGNNLLSSCYKYYWSIDGQYINGRTFNYTFNKDGNYKICMKVYDSCNNCDTIICKEVSIKCNSCNWAGLKPQLYTSTSGKNCLRYFFGVNDLGDTCIKYTWTLDGKEHKSYLGMARYMSDSFVSNGSHTICVKLTNTCKNCDTSLCTTINVTGCGSKCSFAGLDFGFGNKCRDYTFEAKNMNNGCLKYQFYVFDSNTAVALAPGRVSSYTFKHPGTYYIKLIVKDTCHNCDTFIYKSIKVDCSPCNLKPTISWKNDCLKVYFNTAGISGATYYWSFGDGYYASLKEPWHQYLKSGVYKVCLKVSYKDPNTGQTCSETVCQEITVKCGNDCNLKGEFHMSLAGNLLKLSASSNNGYYYFWSFGDGTTGSGKQPNHYYKKPGTYEVCLTIYDKTKKCSVKICKKIVIPQQCNVRAYFTNKISGSTVKFVGVSYNGCKYVWSYGDGTSGYGKDPSHTYTQPGVYNVCLTVYSCHGNCHVTICKKVIITAGTKRCDWAKLGTNFSYSINCPNLILEGKNLNTTGSGCYSYGWGITPAGTNQTTTFYGRVQNIKFSYNGVYNVCMKVYDSCHNCDTVICKTVTINCFNTKKCDWSRVNTSFTAAVNCKTIIAGMNTGGNSCIKLLWYFNGSTTGEHGTYRTWTVKDNGTYKVCLKLYDSCNNCDTVICREVKVDCQDKKCVLPTGWSTSNGQTCGLMYFDGYKVPDNSGSTWVNPCHKYSWSFGDGTYASGKTVYHKYTANGTYKICMKVIDTCLGCDTVICGEVKVNCYKCDWSKAGFSYKIDCNKVTVEGYNLGGCIKYGFGWGDGTGSSYSRVADHKYTKNGSYTICFKAYDTCNKCDTLICKTIKIDCQPCAATAKFTVDSTSTSGIAYITNQSTGGYAFIWDFGDSTYSYSKNPGKHAYAASGSYTICLTVYDSAKTCSTTYCYTVKVLKSRAAGVAEINSMPVVKIYPNPADAYFTIVSDQQNGNYEIVNLQGKTISTGTLSGETRISTSGWSEGVYIVRSTFEGSQVNSRIVITRQ